MNAKTINTAVVIGAGPVGLSAAAHLLARNIQPLVLEKGSSVGSAMSQWGHVRVFSPWKYVIDQAVNDLLVNSGWQHPDLEGLPTGNEIVEQYLIPAANTPELSKVIHVNAEVLAVSRQSHAKSSSSNREGSQYTLHVRASDGDIKVLTTDAVIDASGTWATPNPIGLDGLPVPGEHNNSNVIHYGIPDVAGKDRETYADKTTLVLGGGHSAINVALDLLTLQQTHDQTKVIWGLRSNNIAKLLGGGINDELPARGKLGLAAKTAIDNGLLEVLAPFAVERIDKTPSGLELTVLVDDDTQTITVDRIIVAAGFRPNLSMLRELRLDLDTIVEAPKQLAPLIDPNLHSCGTVPPHGYRELAHPDEHFYIVGMKAYGRAPTFLMLTGYEQVRSIAAWLSGDEQAAKRIELVLPKTGVCSSKSSEPDSSCCGTEPESSDSCCHSTNAKTACCG